MVSNGVNGSVVLIARPNASGAASWCWSGGKAGAGTRGEAPPIDPVMLGTEACGKAPVGLYDDPPPTADPIPGIGVVALDRGGMTGC